MKIKIFILAAATVILSSCGVSHQVTSEVDKNANDKNLGKFIYTKIFNVKKGIKND